MQRRYVEGIAFHLMPRQRLVAEKTIDGAKGLVRPALGNGIDTRTGKARLRHIIWRDVHLYLVNRIQRDRLCTRLPAGCRRIQPKRVVEDGAVKGVVIVLSVPPGKGH